MHLFLDDYAMEGSKADTLMSDCVVGLDTVSGGTVVMSDMLRFSGSIPLPSQCTLFCGTRLPSGS